MSSTTNKKIIQTCDNSNNKTNITMSQYQDFGQYIDIDPTLTGSPQKYECGLFDLLTGNDYLFNNSPDINSSTTTPTLILDGISTPHDSPLFNNNFLSSPSLDPAFGFFPDLSADAVDPNNARSLIQQLNVSTTSSVPSVTIPVDDSPFSTIPVSSALSPALTIPWSTEANSTSSIDDIHASSMSPSILSSYSSNNSPKISPTPGSSTVTSPSAPSILMKTTNTRNRKRSISEMGRDPQVVADELALKRAKNTDAARRSRKRKVMKMEALERQSMELKNENNDLQTRIAVLESEKKGLEVKNVEKEARITMLEQQLSEAHERLVNRN